MILLFHITFAVLSIIFSIWLLMVPSKNKLKAVYSLSIVTILSGIFLVILNPVFLTQTCISGVIFVAFIYATTKIAKFRFLF